MYLHSIFVLPWLQAAHLTAAKGAAQRRAAELERKLAAATKKAAREARRAELWQSAVFTACEVPPVTGEAEQKCLDLAAEHTRSTTALEAEIGRLSAELSAAHSTASLFCLCPGHC